LLYFQGGKVDKTFERNLKRAREETPVSNPSKSSKKAASSATPTAPPGRQMRIGGRNEQVSGSLGLDLARPLPATGGLSTAASGSRLAGSAGKNPFESPSELGWPLRVKSHSQQTSSSDGRNQIGAALVTQSDADCDADQSPRWPDVQKHARAMLGAVGKRDKDAIPGIETFNLERIVTLLAEVVHLTNFFFNGYFYTLSRLHP
jgi:hypothetical protein